MPRRIKSARERLHYFKSAHLQLWGICRATNMGYRDHLLTNIGTVEFFSVSHGTYPGEKYFAK